MTPTKPSGYLSSIFLFALTAITFAAMSIAPIFIAIFMFGTWDAAKEYSIPTAIIISSIFAVGFILFQRHSDEERYKHEVSTEKAIEDLKFDAGKIYCKKASH